MEKVFLIFDILGVLLGGATLIVSLLLPQITRNVSGDEAMIGVVAGAIVLVLSFGPAIVGLVMILLKRKNPA